jgi:hypothetical protein
MALLAKLVCLMTGCAQSCFLYECIYCVVLQVRLSADGGHDIEKALRIGCITVLGTAACENEGSPFFCQDLCQTVL